MTIKLTSLLAISATQELITYSAIYRQTVLPGNIASI
nr:MAG TPA: hypothetical protein [Caudoviricetes sp.]